MAEWVRRLLGRVRRRLLLLEGQQERLARHRPIGRGRVSRLRARLLRNGRQWALLRRLLLLRERGLLWLLLRVRGRPLLAQPQVGHQLPVPFPAHDLLPAVGSPRRGLARQEKEHRRPQIYSRLERAMFPQLGASLMPNRRMGRMARKSLSRPILHRRHHLPYQTTPPRNRPHHDAGLLPPPRSIHSVPFEARRKLQGRSKSLRLRSGYSSGSSKRAVRSRKRWSQLSRIVTDTRASLRSCKRNTSHNSKSSRISRKS